MNQSSQDKEAVDNLLNEFKRQLPEIMQLMNPGITMEELNTTEKDLGITFPASYKRLLSITNGEGPFVGTMCYRLMPIADSIREYSYIKTNVKDSSPIPDVFPEDYAKPQKYSLNRYPFASDGSGNFICLDYSPGPKGKIGQVVTIALGDSDPIDVLADSFTEYLIFLKHALVTGKLAFNDEREEDDDPEELAWKVNFEYRFRFREVREMMAK